MASAAEVAVAVAAAAEAIAPPSVAAIECAPSDLMRFRPIFLEFLDFFFHYGLEIIFRNLNNSFLTSNISLQATF